MKSINFKRKESVIRVGNQDDPRAGRRINWDRIIYFSILGVVLFFLLRWVVLNTVYVEAQGQVILKSVKIQNVDDSRIIEFMVEEGDQVKKGDTLFTYINDSDEQEEDGGGGGAGAAGSAISVGDITINKIKSPDWIDKEIFNTRKQIALNSVQILENEKMISVLSKDLKRLEQEVILDVMPKSKLEDAKLQIEKYGADVAQKRRENGYFGQYLAELEALKELRDQMDDPDNKGVNLSAGASGAGGDGDDERLRAFEAPMDGTVTRIFKEEYEVALKSEEIMWLHKPENVHVKAYFDQEDIDDIDIGDEVSLIFPDGTESIGYIKKFHFTTSKLSEEFQKQYEPTTRAVLVDIAPATKKDLNKWPAYYKMGVIVRKSKY